eukprot:894655-Rhodomonas_salina.1
MPLNCDRRASRLRFMVDSFTPVTLSRGLRVALCISPNGPPTCQATRRRPGCAQAEASAWAPAAGSLAASASLAGPGRRSQPEAVYPPSRSQALRLSRSRLTRRRLLSPSLPVSTTMSDGRSSTGGFCHGPGSLPLRLAPGGAHWQPGCSESPSLSLSLPVTPSLQPATRTRAVSNHHDHRICKCHSSSCMP